MASTATLQLNELEWRSDAVTASAGQIISKLSRQSKLHWGLLSDLGGLNQKMLDLLQYAHTPEAISAVESMAPEQLRSIADKMELVHGRTRMMMAQIGTWDLGFWRRFYVPKLDKLKVYNCELLAHAHAYRENPIILTQRDQDLVITSLLAPAEPNDALRRAFMR